MAKLLDVRNNRRTEVIIRGHKVELKKRQRLYHALREKGIILLAQFNYLQTSEPLADSDDDDQEINEIDSAEEANVVLQWHDEICFKRKELCKIIIDAEFKKKKFL